MTSASWRSSGAWRLSAQPGTCKASDATTSDMSGPGLLKLEISSFAASRRA